MEELNLLLCGILFPAAAALQAPRGVEHRVCWFVDTLFACLAAHFGGELLFGPIAGSSALLVAGMLAVALARAGPAPGNLR